MSVQAMGLLVSNLTILLLRRRLAVCKHIFDIIHTKDRIDKSCMILNRLAIHVNLQYCTTPYPDL